MQTNETPVAHFLGKLNGKRIHRFPVVVKLNNSQTFETEKFTLFIVSDSAANAANYVRDHMNNRPETEIIAIGPKGGETYRYIGWYSAIAGEMFEEVKQMKLF